MITPVSRGLSEGAHIEPKRWICSRLSENWGWRPKGRQKIRGKCQPFEGGSIQACAGTGPITSWIL